MEEIFNGRSAAAITLESAGEALSEIKALANVNPCYSVVSIIRSFAEFCVRSKRRYDLTDVRLGRLPFDFIHKIISARNRSLLSATQRCPIVGMY